MAVHGGDPASSPEYRTFQKHFPELKIGLEPSAVADMAFSMLLLTAEEKERVLVGGLTRAEMNERLLEPIHRRILADRSRYHVFVEVLGEEPVYNDMVADLNATFQELSVADSPDGRGQDSEAMIQSERANQQPSMDDFLQYVKTPNWFRLGLKLRIPEADMRMIKKDTRGDSKEALEKICEAYLEDAHEPRWGEVVSALHAIGDKRLARELERSFC